MATNRAERSINLTSKKAFVMKLNIMLKSFNNNNNNTDEELIPTYVVNIYPLFNSKMFARTTLNASSKNTLIFCMILRFTKAFTTQYVLRFALMAVAYIAFIRYLPNKNDLLKSAPHF